MRFVDVKQYSYYDIMIFVDVKQYSNYENQPPDNPKDISHNSNESTNKNETKTALRVLEILLCWLLLIY